MEGNLGFTFYPKDWWTSDTYFILSPFERYVYLELIFMMYSNGGFVLDNKGLVEGRLRTTIKDEIWSKIIDFLVKDGDKLTHSSVNSRLRKAIANRENGKKGGAPKGNSNAKNGEAKQPKQPKKTTQNNPPLEREIESEREIENKENTPTSYSDDDEENFEGGNGEGNGSGKGIDLSSLGKQPIEILKEKLAGAQSWFDQIGMKNKILPEEVPRWFEKFCTHCLAQGEEEKTEKDFKQHFANWVSKMKSLGLGLEIKSETPKTATDVAAEVIMENYENGAYNDQY